MKMQVIILLVVCVVSAIADPISKQKLSVDNKEPLSERKATETKHSEGLLNNVEPEQKNDAVGTDFVTNVNDENGEYRDSNTQIIIESIDSSVDEVTSPSPMLIDNDIALNGDIYSNTLVNNPDEIMETAAGFVPIPIFSKRQKARRRFATRPHFKRNPYAYKYRETQYYYPYYRFYYPSSLNYY
ncbi:uncharacterized protein LOC113520537 [Galleria mellonella]|uniref:Uncharacterized protein LOC113520537 n=1 Tax=Galleria mellonella TaxID=7137 RepID=A0A6J1WZ47_GALME|nr:uncharacterized protein LOC113520537 [Galleria mellonella]